MSDAKITLTPAASTTGRAATPIHCSAKMMSPSADQDAAEAADGFGLAREVQTTPTKIRSGASHERSNDSTTVTSDVPTSAPEHHGERGRGADQVLARRKLRRSARSPCCSGSEPVTPTPAKNARDGVVRRNAQQAAQRAAVEPQDAGADDVRAPDEQRHAGERLSSVCTSR